MKKLVLIAALCLLALPAQAAITFVVGHAVNLKTGCAGASASCTMTFGFTAGAGNDIVYVVNFDTACTVNTVTDSSGTNSYTFRVGSTNVASGQRAEAYTSHLGANATSITVNFTAVCNGQFTTMGTGEYSGVLAYGNVNGQNGNSGTATAAPTMQNANNVAAGGGWINGGPVATASSGTIRTQGNDGTNGTVVEMDATNAAITVTFTSATWAWVGVELCATNPCSGGVSSPPSRSLMGVGQ